MNRFRYRIYSEHKEPDRPLRALVASVTSMSLVHFPSALRRHLPRDATVSSQPIVGDRNSIYVVVETVLSEESTDQAVADCLKGKGPFVVLSVEKLERG